MKYTLILLIWGIMITMSPDLFGQKKTKISYPRKAYRSEVKNHLNMPTIHINGIPQSPIQYALTDAPGGRWSWEELAQHNLALFGRHGFNMYQLDISFEHMWKENGQLDIQLALEQIRGVLKANPNAAVVFRLHVNAPFWWLDKHPEECVEYADTTPVPRLNYGLYSPINDDPRPMERVSLASEKWLKESSEMTALFCKKLACTKEGRAVIGIQVACGVYGEWHYWGFLDNEPDVGQAMTTYFKKWSKEQYTTTDNLAKAWNNPSMTFDQIQVPNMAERKSQFGIFRDPLTERKTIDYFRAQHELTADRIIHFAKLVKENWPRPIITGTFYGYFFSVFGREVAGGHLALEKILQSPHIDYLSAPQCYGPKSRLNGEVYRSRGLVRSCQLNGKLWLDEMDFEPNLHYPFYKHQDIYLSLGRASTRRNMIYSLLKGMGLWFYEFGITGKEDDDFHLKYVHSSGFWDHPDIMSDISRIKKIFDKKIQEEKPYKSNADVLFVLDTESSLYTASLLNKNPMTVLSVDWSTLSAFRAGILYDAIHLSDLKKIDLTQYKTVIFGNCYVLSDDQVDYIKNKVAINGRDIIWMTAPGFTSHSGIDLNRIQSITGFSVDTTRLNDTVQVDLAEEIHPFFQNTAQTSSFSHKEGIWPVFYIRDSNTTTLGRYHENRLPAYAKKEFDDHTAWYIAMPAKEEKANILRYILSESQSHQYIDDTKAVVYGGWDLLFYYNVFRKKGEKRSITLRSGKVIEITSPGRGCGILLDANTGEILVEGA